MSSDKNIHGNRYWNFKEKLWYHPIGALASITLQTSEKTEFVLKFIFDAARQEELANKYGLKKKKRKTERIFGFKDVESFRECVFEIR